MSNKKCPECGSERLILEGTIKDDTCKDNGKDVYRCKMCGKARVYSKDGEIFTTIKLKEEKFNGK